MFRPESVTGGYYETFDLFNHKWFLTRKGLNWFAVLQCD